MARTERPSGLAIAAFALSIPGLIAPGLAIFSLGMALAALIVDRRPPRRRWAGWWALAISLASLLAYLDVVVRGP